MVNKDTQLKVSLPQAFFCHKIHNQVSSSCCLKIATNVPLKVKSQQFYDSKDTVVPWPIKNLISNKKKADFSSNNYSLLDCPNYPPFNMKIITIFCSHYNGPNKY